MATYGVTIKNLAEIRRAFQLSPKLMATELDAAIKKSAISIQRDSMINSPVLTGYLRASHEVTFTPLKGVIEPTANYAIYVHEGTYKMAARPFLADAVQTNEQKVNDYFVKAVDNVFGAIGRMV